MRTRQLLAVALLGASCLLVPASAAPVPPHATWSEAYFPSADGTLLHADVLLPTGRQGRRVPVIVSAGPYFAHAQPAALAAPQPTATGPRSRFYDLVEQGRVFQRGYALVQVDTRGYGGSGGCTDLGGPLEQSDVKAAVEWAARQPWSTGKVGMWGKSYDAWTELMALAERPKGLAAVVVQSPLDSTYKGVFDNGVHYGSDWFTFTEAYQQMSVVPPTVYDGQQAHTNNATGTVDPACYASVSAGALDPDPSTPFWRARDLVRRAGASRVPVLWSHGFNDVNTKPTNLLDTWSRLRGPKRAWFGQWDHVRGNESDLVGRNGFMDEAMAWFGHYLKGEPLPAYPKVRVQNSEGEWRSEARWPPADAVVRRMPLLPGSYLDGPGNQADRPLGGSWTVSQPAPRDVRLAGAIRLRVTASAPLGATLVATLYDVPPSGGARLLTRGAHLLPTAGQTSFDLWPEDWLLARGHRLAVHLAGDDSLVYQPIYTGSMVTVTAGSLDLPVLARTRRTESVGGPAEAQRPVATIDPADLAGRQVRADFGPPAG